MGRLTKNLSLGKSFLGKHKDERTADCLSRLLRDYGSSNDIGGKERSLTARRLLRKDFPEHASKLDPLVRYEDLEWTYLLRAYQRHDWVLRECVDFSDGMSLQAGVEVSSSNSSFLVTLSNFQCSVPAQYICKAKDFQKRLPSPIPRFTEVGLDL
jgi:hypothetical protein